jgi:hypothetical protein
MLDGEVYNNCTKKTEERNFLLRKKGFKLKGEWL